MYAKDGAGKGIVGTLMSVEEDPNSRYRFEIWFDYTREIMNTLSEGAMVAVPNFYLDREHPRREWASVLEISNMLPVHYAIAQNQTGFPGFLVEAARSAGQDWIDQVAESTDDTTKVRCIAIPTNLMLDDEGEIRQEEGLPMVGHAARLLDNEMTERLANLGIDLKRDDAVVVGPLIRDEKVQVYLRVEEALRTHFAVFGYTGAGKSNLLSTLVAKLIERADDRPPVKIVMFDLMGEYSVLLMDLLVRLSHARLLAVGPETLPDSVLKVYQQPAANRAALIKPAAADLMKTSLYPKALKSQRAAFETAFAALLKTEKIRVWQERELSIGKFAGEHRGEVMGGSMGNSKQTVLDLIDRLERDFANEAFSPERVRQAITMIDSTNNGLTNTASNNLRNFKRLIQDEAAADRPRAPTGCRVSIPKIVEYLNDEVGSSLTVVQAADPDALRTFASNLGNAVYEARRRSGQNTPLVSFLFDEADEFIPGTYEKDSGYARSAGIVKTLARRGRKFGLGIGIATQRITYLDTNIMAQPHTYFISKLPRKSDRERVCEAFGISEEMFRQTFKFRKGNWLLVSHDATGLESVPLPVHADNADQRILDWLKSLSGAEGL